MKDNIIIRRAIIDDAKHIFSINNSKYVREQSLNQEEIIYDEHLIWFQKMLNSEDVFFFSALDTENNFIGSVHFDKDSNEGGFTVSIAIDKAFAGRGLGTDILQKSSTLFKKINNAKIIAFVKTLNIASNKAFLKAGYSLISEVIILGEAYKKYEL